MSILEISYLELYILLGTTPYLKKERVKIKSDEKEKCREPQVPIGWENPMLDVASDIEMRKCTGYDYSAANFCFNKGLCMI